MLKKLSELKYKIDKFGTVDIHLGDGGILKASPAELLVIASEILTIQSIETRMKAAENIYLHTLKALDIPDELVEKVRSRLHSDKHCESRSELMDRENEERKEEEKKETEPKEEKKEIVIEGDHKMLFQFITAFVNESSKENDFDIEEFSPFDIDIKDLPKVLRRYGFNARMKNKIVTISLIGDQKDNE
jgi:hypothetical protein